MTRVLVCGGRRYLNPDPLWAALDAIHKKSPISLIIEGGQRTRDEKTREIIGGADWWGFKWATGRCIPWVTEFAEWGLHGAAAGPIRNQAMIDKHRPDKVVAAPGGRGTADMVRRALVAGIDVISIDP